MRGRADEVQVVDLGPWLSGDEATRAALGRQVALSMQELGFVVLVGHGIPDEARARARRELRRAFALPEAVKRRYEAPALGTWGWLPLGAEANGYASGERTPPDLKESFVFTTAELAGHGHAPPNVWPAEVPGVRAAITDLLVHLERLHLEVLRVCAVALGLADGEWFAARARHASNTLNVNWYPPRSRTGVPEQGQYRIGPHSDFGTVTLLDREPGLGGLQVRRRDGTWADVPHVQGALVVNCGDLLQLWSGGRWRSAPHRVLPPPAEAPEESLLSLVYFCEPDADTVVEPLPGSARGDRFAPVRAGDYLAARLADITVTS